MSHTYVSTYNSLLYLTLNPALSLRNNQAHIFHWAIPLSPPTLLLIIFVLLVAWHIEGLCLGEMRILWCLVVLGALRVLSLGLPHILGLEVILLLCISLSVFVSLLKLLLILAIPVFFHILADRATWSPSTSLKIWYCCTGVLLIWVLGFNLYRQFSICHGVEGRGNRPIFPQFKKIARYFPCQGVLAWTEAFSSGGGLFSDVEGFCLSEFTGALVFVWGCCVASLPGSGLATTPCTSL